MAQHTGNRRTDHDCRCQCGKCKSGNHCHNLATGCRAQHW